MGYTTEFRGHFTLDKPLTGEQATYLRKMAGSRRIKRNPTATALLPDPYRNLVGLPIGIDGEFYVASADDGNFGQGRDFSRTDDPSILDYNEPPRTQPGLWLQWEPTDDNQGIEWNGSEKFYNYEEWMAYLCKNFLTPWGIKVSGTVRYRGEDFDDQGELDGAEIQRNADAYLKRSVYF